MRLLKGACYEWQRNLTASSIISSRTSIWSQEEGFLARTSPGYGLAPASLENIGLVAAFGTPVQIRASSAVLILVRWNSLSHCLKAGRSRSLAVAHALSGIWQGTRRGIVIFITRIVTLLDGEAATPCLIFSSPFRASGSRKPGPEIVLEKMREHFEVADRYAPPYGLIDISAPDDGYAGLVYGCTFFGNSPLHRYVEQANWVYAGSKHRDRVRGIYWGNYFGPAILKRLGGRERFLAGYRQQAGLHSGDGSRDGRIWEFTNGVFVSLCLDPLGWKPGPPLHAGSNLFWLVQELGSHGVLCAWGEDNEKNCEGFPRVV